MKQQQNSVRPFALDRMYNSRVKDVYGWVLDQNNRLSINKAMLNSNPYTLTLEESNGDPSITLAGNATGERRMVNDRSGVFVAYWIAHNATSENYLLQITNNNIDRQFFNSPIHATNFVGNGLRPHMLPFPFIIEDNTSLTFSFQDLSGSGNTIHLNFIGRKFYMGLDEFYNLMGLPRVPTNPQVYTTEQSISLPSTATDVTGYINLNGDSEFVFYRAMEQSDSSNFWIRFTDVRAGRELQNSWVHASAFFNSAQYYKDWPIAVWDRKKRIRCVFRNQSGGTNDVRIAFVGQAVYSDGFGSIRGNI